MNEEKILDYFKDLAKLEDEGNIDKNHIEWIKIKNNKLGISWTKFWS